MATTINPSLFKPSAYCTVNMLSAALVILYAGVGARAVISERDMLPNVVDLKISRDLRLGETLPHVDNSLFLARSQ